MNTIQKTFSAPAGVDMVSITGSNDCLLRMIEEAFSVRLTVRGNELTLLGDTIDIEMLEVLFNDMFRQALEGEIPTKQSVEKLIRLVHSPDVLPSTLRNDIVLSYKGKAIRPKSAGQKRFVDAIRANSITFGLGPAGTGKTFLTCAMAVDALQHKQIERIVLTRPIVEAGESLGFLPGTMMEKVDPYIRPLYDALFEMLDTSRAQRYLDDGTIEITPLAFMRGRTFNGSFVILDEAQNTTSEQMKMFLTRLGFGSKMVITGDESQSDNPRGPLGIASARERLSSIEDIAFCELDGTDVVRNSLVAKIITAYERHV